MESKFKFDPESGTMKAVVPGAISDQDIEKKEVTELPDHKDMTQLDLDKKKLNINVAEDNDEPIVGFKERSDYKIFQILDEDTRAVMGYIAGYGLDISFNLQELKGVERIEQFLEALNGLFRKIITDQILNQNN